MLKMLKKFLPIIDLMLNVFNLMTGLGFLALSGQYLLDGFGFIEIPNPRWIGWFVDDIFHMGMSAMSNHVVICMMLLIGISLVITSVHNLYRVTVKSTKVQEQIPLPLQHTVLEGEDMDNRSAASRRPL